MPQIRQKVEGELYRTAAIRVRAKDADAKDGNRTFDLSFSSEEPVLRTSWFEEPWIEILSHDAGDVDFTRLQNGAPLLYNHRIGPENRLGKVENATVANKRGEATVRMSRRNALMDEFWRDIEDEILVNVSVGYQIVERVLVKEHADGPDEYRCRWMPFEISIVDIPADATIGVGRSKNYEVIDIGGATMPKTTENTPAEGERKAQVPVTPSTEPATDNTEAVRAQALADEQTRRAAIRESFTPHAEDADTRALLDACLDDVEVTAAEANTRLLKHLGTQGTPSARIEVGETDKEKFRDATLEALSARAGLISHDEIKMGGELRGYSLQELARMSLERAGVNTRRLSRLEMVGRAITHSSSDFPYILSNIANKSMLKGYMEVPEVFDRISRVGNLSDFKVADRLNMSAFSDLEEVLENGEYKHGTFSENREQIQLATYGKKFAISRQAIINDDLNAMSRIPLAMGQAAKRKVGDLVWAVITANAAMADGTVLFHADHSNLASSGGAPTVATVSAAKAAMAKQTDPSGNATVRMPAATIIVPVALEGTTKTLVASETDPSKANSKVPNIHRGTLEVVSDARLDVNSAVKWYLGSDAQMFDTIEVGYLDGNPNPFMEQQNGWDVDGVEMKVRIDAAAKALDHRGLYQNPGA